MNPRIQELAEQAGASVLREQTRSGDWVDFSDYTGFDHTKFAELIVRECADLANEGFGSANFGLGIKGQNLKDHFGVRE